MNHNLTAAPEAAFDYAALAPEAAKWLREKTGAIRLAARQTAASAIAIGTILREVKDRLPHGTWLDWLDAEFAGSRTTAARLMQAAKSFGNIYHRDKFAPVSLYLLSSPTAPPGAREYALERAADGAEVTVAEAREILDAYKPRPTPTVAEARALVPRAAGKRKALPPPVAPPPDWSNRLRQLLDGGATLHVWGLPEADEGTVTYAATLYPAEGYSRPRRVMRQSLDDLFNVLCECEPKKVCQGPCNASKALSDFARDCNQRDGHLARCRDCERARMRDYKRRKKAERTTALRRDAIQADSTALHAGQ